MFLLSSRYLPLSRAILAVEQEFTTTGYGIPSEGLAGVLKTDFMKHRELLLRALSLQFLMCAKFISDWLSYALR
jgi:hypothetical protein